MTNRLAGKRAVITAAGQGIGRAIAEQFIAQGAIVFASDIDASKLKGLNATTQALDAQDGAAIAAYAKSIGGVDILVNAAGYVHHGSVLECDDKAWDFSFNLNVRSMHYMIKNFVPHMVEQKSGSVINIASCCSSIKGFANRYVYGATKAAVIGLTKACAMDFITKGVRFNAICPGTVQSPSLDERITALAASSGKSFAEVQDMFVGRQPMGRLGEAIEIAHMAVYLGSNESIFTTGQALSVDGGVSI
jgi:2-keto-3-deoxy-L-fuconate dehydrogenase